MAKSKYLRYLVEQYIQIGFKEFDLTELAQFSIRDWKNKKFPIPRGYMRNNHMYSNKLVKISKKQLLEKKIFKK